jgi:multiple sugar transport system ATP-binding protein
MAPITFSHVTKRFGDTIVLNNLHLAINDQEFLVLVGPSGCGKSTALRCLAGLETVTEGHIYIGDQIVNHLPPRDRNIAMVFQSYALYPHMTVYDNIAFALKLRKEPRHVIDTRVREAAHILGIDHLLSRKPQALSGGQQQRVALGRAIVRNPAVFLMDEPLSNLDAHLRHQTRAEISKLHQRINTTFIYVTHDQTEAMTMGTRIAVLSNGVLQQLDTPQTLYHKPANTFVASFIGSPAMNFFHNVLLTSIHNTLQLSIPDIGTIPLSPTHIPTLQPYINQPLILGIRPENIHDAHYIPTLVQPHPPIHALVTVTEHMGSEVYVHIQHNTHEFIGRFDPRTTARPGHPIPIVIDTENIHFFHMQTHEAIQHSCWCL